MDQAPIFTSRQYIQPIVIGVVSTFALMILSMSLAASLGLGEFTFSQLPSLGAAFWGWVTISWAASLYIGARLAIATGASRARNERVLLGFLTWASCSILTVLFLNYAYGDIVFGDTLEDFRPNGMIWSGFLANFAALGTSIAAGLVKRRASSSHGNVVERKRAA